MAHFRGTVTGNRSTASRLGHKTTGLTTQCNGWDIGATCSIYHNEKDGRDEITIKVTRGSNQAGLDKWIGTFFVDNGEIKPVTIK